MLSIAGSLLRASCLEEEETFPVSLCSEMASFSRLNDISLLNFLFTFRCSISSKKSSCSLSFSVSDSLSSWTIARPLLASLERRYISLLLRSVSSFSFRLLLRSSYRSLTSRLNDSTRIYACFASIAFVLFLLYHHYGSLNSIGF